MDFDREERALLAGERGEAARRALEYQVAVGRFWGARRFVRVTNVHMMGDIEVMGDGGLEWLRGQAGLGARCAVATTTNARCIDFAHWERLGQDGAEVAKERELVACLRRMDFVTTDTCINYQSGAWTSSPPTPASITRRCTSRTSASTWPGAIPGP